MNTKELAIIAAVGLGAYLLITKQARAGTVRMAQPGVNPNLTNARPVYNPYPGAQQPSAAQLQAQIDAQKYGALYGIGSFIKWLTSGGGVGSGQSGSGTYAPGVAYAPGVTAGWAGNMTGNVRPSNDYGLGTLYGQPDGIVVNPPYNVYDPSEIAGIGVTSSSDKAALYSDEGYYPYTQ